MKMKVKNKKTGEIIILIDHIFDNYNSLNEFEQEWENYEEPKVHWYIYGAEPLEVDDGNWDEEFINELKITGNYFETEEEAEKAVEKLKAWKRLKDYYVKFKLDFVRNTIHFTYRIDGTLHSAINEERIIFDDMKTIFGGEE